MNIQQPIIDQMKSAKEKLSATTDSLTNKFTEMKSGIQNNLGEFSAKGMNNASSEFLQSNGLLAKCGFIILLFILFLFLFKVGVQLLGYLLGPYKNPYLIYGKLEGTTLVTISQDPANKASIPILRSNNGKNGAEFTWSVWLYLNLGATDEIKPIFVKGNSNSTSTSGLYETNGPGMYVSSTSGIGALKFALDDVYGTQNIMDISNVPLQKWVHIAYRLQNTILDIYVNGVIQNRKQMTYAPKQNFYDITVCGGFKGSLSNLRYYSSALTVFDINNIIMWGPNTNPSKLSADGKSASDSSYLSREWYINTFQ
jgi:hypothetical protein